MATTCTKYELGKGGKLISIDETAGKGLQIGQVLKWGGNMGWASCDLVILQKHMDIGYFCFNRDEPDKNTRLHMIEYSSIKREDDPALWHGQHMFLTPEIVPAGQVLEMQNEHNRQADAFQAGQDKATAAADLLEAKGRELWPKLIPAGTTHLIVAECMQDDSDIQSDYFSSHAVHTVILAASKSKRDNFAEMRKAAAKIPETRQFATPDLKDRNGETRTEINKSWWEPADEQREKYSGGSGYYLQVGGCHSGGWRVSKTSAGAYQWNEATKKHEQSTTPSRETCIILAQRYEHLNK